MSEWVSEWVQVPAGIHLLTAVLFSVCSATVRSRVDTVMSLESSRLFNLIMTPLKLFCQVVPEDSCSSLSALRFAENWRLDSGSPGLQLILLFPHALKNTLHTAVFQFNYGGGGTENKQTEKKRLSSLWYFSEEHLCICGSFALFFSWSGFSDIHVLSGCEWLICCKLTIISCTALPANG